MGTVFEDACRAASNSTDTVYADCWRYIPMASDDPNSRRSPDPLRRPQRIEAVFLDPYARAFSGIVAKQGLKAETPGHASKRPTLDIAHAQLPYDIREGDRVEREKDGSLWVIAEPRPNGVGTRTMCDINLLSARDR